MPSISWLLLVLLSTRAFAEPLHAGQSLDQILQEIQQTEALAASRSEELPKKQRTAHKFIKHHAEKLQRTSDAQNIGRMMQEIYEVKNSYWLKDRLPIPHRLNLVSLPFFMGDLLSNPVGRGSLSHPSLNLGTLAGDLSQLDPAEPSSYWKRKYGISTLELYRGLGRAELPSITGVICEYKGPKTSYGVHAGFEAKCGSSQVKIKFGENSSEAFGSRIFWALGYNVDEADYSPEAKVRYDRKLLMEFNSRKNAATRFEILPRMPLFRVGFQEHLSPFKFIQSVVLKDGTEIKGGFEFAKRLLKSTRGKKPEVWGDNYNEAFENQVDHLVFEANSFQAADTADKTVGPWDWNEFDRAEKRELRGVGILAAWLGWFDSRYDNNRLRIREDADGQLSVVHFISDLGGIIGKSDSIFFTSNDKPNKFPWTFTKPTRDGFKVHDFTSLHENDAFRRMNLDDAKWMARQIAQLTENQITAGLIGAGFEASAVKVILEKLLSRRDKMIVDLRLSGEIAPLRPVPIDRRFDYDPRVEPVPMATLPGGTVVQARIGDQIVREGRLVPVRN